MPSRERREKRKAAGRCPNCGRPLVNYCMCRGCYDKCKLRQERLMAPEAQDLSAYPNLSRGEHDGKRWFSGWWPRPSWTKHNRTALTAKPGYRPLVVAAKKYEQFIAQAVLVNDLLGWIREDTEYVVEVISFVHRCDMDQWSGGLLDGLVKSGALADDKHGAALVSRRERIGKDQQEAVFIAVSETEKGKSDG